MLNPTAADAARAAVDAGKSSGEPPTDAVLRAIPPLRAALTLHVPGGDGDDRGAVTPAPPSPTGILTRPRRSSSPPRSTH